MILVITSANDRTADRVVAEVQRRGATAHRFDFSEFPANLSMSARLDNRSGWSGTIETTSTTVNLADIQSIYYRRPTDFSFPEDVAVDDLTFAKAEARRAFGGLLFSMPVRWVNHPSRVADAEFKPYQLDIARKCGLKIPPTLLTDDPSRARDFCDSRTAVVYKPLSAANIVAGDSVALIFTSRVNADEVDNPDVAVTMNMFQEWIPKSYDVRLTVFGSRMFGVAIYADTADSYLDWRIDYTSLRYECVEIPTSVSTGVSAYLKRFGLLYGAFDFAVAGEDWYFLECNANGQYGWIEAETGLPMTGALAELLTCEHA